MPMEGALHVMESFAVERDWRLSRWERRAPRAAADEYDISLSPPQLFCWVIDEGWHDLLLVSISSLLLAREYCEERLTDFRPARCWCSPSILLFDLFACLWCGSQHHLLRLLSAAPWPKWFKRHSRLQRGRRERNLTDSFDWPFQRFSSAASCPRRLWITWATANSLRLLLYNLFHLAAARVVPSGRPIAKGPSSLVLLYSILCCCCCCCPILD